MSNKLACAALVFAPLIIGCGGSGTDNGDMSVVYRVQCGDYNLANFTKSSDTCSFNPTNTTLAVKNDGNGNLALGTKANQGYSDQNAYSMGSGMFTDSSHATLSATVDVNAAGCMYHQVRTNTVTVTADNTLSVQFTQTRSGFTGSCPAPLPPDPCMTAATFTLSMPVGSNPPCTL